MKELIRKGLVSFLEKKGKLLVDATDKNNVSTFIESLYPYQTQHELIRLGPNGDGGYLVPDDLEGIEACFSPGVYNVSKFELDCLKYGMKLFLADKSVEKSSIDLPEDQYDFLKMFVGCTTNDDFITMDEWVNAAQLSPNSDLLLQMDIEGSEYDAIINMSDSLLKRFRIIVIEFHNLDEIWNPHCFTLNQTVFSKLLQTHQCVHIHPNNCCGIETRFGIEIPRVAEFTFIRKDRAQPKKPATSFPHALDYDNAGNETIILPTCWYKSK